MELSQLLTTQEFKARAVPQAVRRWLSTAEAGVRIRAACVRFVVDKAALGQVFHLVLPDSPANHSTNFFIIITRGLVQ
jgi:hypothetical protein